MILFPFLIKIDNKKAHHLIKRGMLKRTYFAGIPRGIPAVIWYFGAENL
jgi:hypothetical protein